MLDFQHFYVEHPFIRVPFELLGFEMGSKDEAKSPWVTR
jgi:hypothetical protein